MGSIQLAKCDCGFEQEISVGAGRRDYNKRSLSPYYCKECNSIFSGNTYDEEIICKNCKSNNVLPYDNPELFKDVNDETTGNNHKVSFCPQCKNFSLIFKVVGRWD